MSQKIWLESGLDSNWLNSTINPTSRAGHRPRPTARQSWPMSFTAKIWPRGWRLTAYRPTACTRVSFAIYSNLVWYFDSTVIKNAVVTRIFQVRSHFSWLIYYNVSQEKWLESLNWLSPFEPHNLHCTPYTQGSYTPRSGATSTAGRTIRWQGRWAGPCSGRHSRARRVLSTAASRSPSRSDHPRGLNFLTVSCLVLQGI